MSKPLGRRTPKDWVHLDRYPLTAAQMPSAPVPVVIGVPWYENFDTPAQDSQGHWWIGRDGNLGRVRGGHCVCLKPRGVRDLPTAWTFYDQGAEGACVGFGASRAMSLLNRKRYFARWLWDRAKEIDPWADTNPGDDNGTEVRAALRVLKDHGHVRWSSRYANMNDDPADFYPRSSLFGDLEEGIAAYRWATSTDDAVRALGYSDLGYVDLLNSWGRFYPRLVRLPVEVFDRLRREDGEIGVVTDR